MAEDSKQAQEELDDAVFAEYCRRAHGQWDRDLDTESLTYIGELFQDRTLSGALGLIGVLAVNVINCASDNEDMACRVSRALGRYIHDRCHSSFEAIKIGEAMAEKAESKTRGDQ
jgi:hypothetical protein